jgi:phage baseplate assembly protein W
MFFDNENNFLGKGWSFPPAFSRMAKTVEMTSQVEDIEKSLEILLTTSLGERIMQPRYGCNTDHLIFETLDTGTKTIMIDRIKTAVLFFEPRIEVKKVEIDTTHEVEGQVFLQIEYEIPTTNSRFNFVFPFYKSEGTELDLLTGNHPLGN